MFFFLAESIYYHFITYLDSPQLKSRLFIFDTGLQSQYPHTSPLIFSDLIRLLTARSSRPRYKMTTEQPNQNRVGHQQQELKFLPVGSNIDRHSINDEEGGVPTSPTTLTSPRTVSDAEEESNEKANEPYCILTRKKLIILLIITASSGMLSPLSANIYFPALNNIQQVEKN